MRLFRRDYAPVRGPRRSFFDDLEQLLRRTRAVGLAAPLLLFVGFGLGEVAHRAIPAEGSQVLADSTMPRVQLEVLSRNLSRVHDSGVQTFEYVHLYQDHVAPVEAVLRRRGVSEATARQVAWPLVEHSYRRGLDPAFVLSIVLMESGGKPTATSFVGAKGLMQVMPMWAGRWRGCGRNLYDIETNLCNGTSILDWYLDNYPGDERRALLGYNGCVRGSNTPDCHAYPDKVTRLRNQVRREMNAARPQRAAAAP
jgi:soluble lytic murein transglycosylase-like protein